VKTLRARIGECALSVAGGVDASGGVTRVPAFFNLFYDLGNEGR
jgi:hypothetical protein